MIQGIHYKLKKFKIIKKIDNDIILFKLKYFSDLRGYFIKLFENNELSKYFSGKVRQINYVKSKNIRIFRGFHYQSGKYSENKLITCIKGKIQVIIIQANKKSKNFLKSYKFIISEKNKHFLLVPKNFANGYLVLEKNSEVIYLSNKDYNIKYEKKINPFDPKLKLNWDRKKLILSKKDRNIRFL